MKMLFFIIFIIIMTFVFSLKKFVLENQFQNRNEL